MDAYQIVKPLIYRLTPEQAHGVTVALLRLAGGFGPARWLLQALFRSANDQPVEAFGLRFPNVLGLAAGYDKDGLAFRGLDALGFGHLELGTVTPKPQPGNPSPRLFRLVQDEAVINRMGFPGKGADFLARRLRGRKPGKALIGINLGKNKITPAELAGEDYRQLVEIFAPIADFLVVNVSSPNTPGLRDLQTRAALEGILTPLRQARAQAGKPTPILVKLAPDLDDAGLDEALDAILASGMDGVIAANTTLRRDGLTSAMKDEVGGMSGTPLGPINLAFLRKVVQRLEGRLPVVASGGVMDARGARERLDAGAVLVQLYTGLIYSGPGLVKQILDAPEMRQAS